MKKLILLSLVFISLSELSYSITRYALNNGFWENPLMWTAGDDPECGDSIVIPAGVTITISSNLDFTACLSPMKLSVLGTLTFQTGKKIRLPCGSGVYVFNGGEIDPGGGGGSSNLIDVCNVTVWVAGMGPMTGPDCLPPGNDCNNFVLPVEFLSFTGEKTEEGVQLIWYTASEKENDKFIIEKSTNGKDFYGIATVKGAGTTNIQQVYTATDKELINQVVYYRIRQVDFNGDYSFSGIIAVKPMRTNNLIMHPNPASSEIFIRPGDEQETVYIYDFAGKLMDSGLLQDDGLYNTEKLKAGVYSVVLKGEVTTQRGTLVISD